MIRKMSMKVLATGAVVAMMAAIGATSASAQDATFTAPSGTFNFFTSGTPSSFGASFNGTYMSGGVTESATLTLTGFSSSDEVALPGGGFFLPVDLSSISITHGGTSLLSLTSNSAGLSNFSGLTSLAGNAGFGNGKSGSFGLFFTSPTFSGDSNAAVPATNIQFTSHVAPVPEASTVVSFGSLLLLGGLVAVRRRRLA